MFWMKSILVKNLYAAVIYNNTFKKTSRFGLMFERMNGVFFTVRVGHLSLNLDWIK